MDDTQKQQQDEICLNQINQVAPYDPNILNLNNQTEDEMVIMNVVLFKKIQTQAGAQQLLPQSLIKKIKQEQLQGKKPITQDQVKFIKTVKQNYYLDLRHRFKYENYQQILYGICNIFFEKLTTINISSMNITTIQPFQFLNSPFTITCQLYGNHLRTLKPLIKNSTMKNLATLTFYFNPISELTDFFKANMKISHFQYDGSLVCQTVQNLNPLFKNPCERFKTLYIQSHKRIYQKKILAMLQKKNQSDNIYFPNLKQH